MWEQDILDKWSREQGINGVVFTGYRNLGSYAGMSHGRGYGTPGIRIEIEVDSHYEKHRLVCKGILWHEFGHAYNYWNSGEMGHGRNWLGFYIKRFHLVLLGFLAPFVRW